MAHKNHILERTIAGDLDGSALLALLTANGYGAGGWVSHTGRWIVVSGVKEQVLESAFADYEVSNPPAFMTKTKDMTHREIRAIVTTIGATEGAGWDDGTND